MKLPQFSLRDLFWLVLVCVLGAFALPGCALLREEPMPMPRGTSIPTKDLPEVVREQYSRLRPEQPEPKVERLENGGYRFEIEGGEVIYLDETGKVRGGVI